MKGEFEWERTIEIMKRGLDGFDPSKEAEKAKNQSKYVADNV